MSVKVQVCEKEFAEWCTNIPRVGKSIKSPCFSLEGNDWNFNLTSQSCDLVDSETWSMKFRKKKMDLFASFLLVVYVRGTTKDLYMTHKTITAYNTEIWNFSHDSFFKHFPLVEVVGGKATFVFTFDYAIRDKGFQRIERDHRSVQTVSLSYLDGRHCLENLSLDLRKLMDDGSDPDVQLRCGDCTIPAHKLILSARSEVFRTMMSTDMQEGREGFVQIVDMEPKVFEIFVRYLYSGILPDLSEDIASALYETGDKYHVEALRRRCGGFLAENLTHENASGILAMADAHSDKTLKDRVVAYVLEEKIPTNDEWTKFCDDNPRLAMEVFREAYKQSFCSQ